MAKDSLPIAVQFATATATVCCVPPEILYLFRPSICINREEEADAAAPHVASFIPNPNTNPNTNPNPKLTDYDK